MIKLIFIINIVIILILTLFFNKSITISKGQKVKINYKKSKAIANTISRFVFTSFIIYIIYASNSYTGWRLLLSLPFTFLILFPFFDIIKGFNSKEILSIDISLNIINIGEITYNINDIDTIKVIKRVGQNLNDTNDYDISLITSSSNEIQIINLDSSDDAILIINELENLLKIPLECFKDGGVLGVKKVSRKFIL